MELFRESCWAKALSVNLKFLLFLYVTHLISKFRLYWPKFNVVLVVFLYGNIKETLSMWSIHLRSKLFRWGKVQYIITASNHRTLVNFSLWILFLSLAYAQVLKKLFATRNKFFPAKTCRHSFIKENNSPTMRVG